MLDLFRHALRSLGRSRLASAVIILSIGLGVGAATAVFTWMEQLVRRPLPAVEGVDRLVSVATRVDAREEGVSYPEYLDWRDSLGTVRGLAVFAVRQFGFRAGGDRGDPSQPVWGLIVSDNYFDVLGVAAAAGRTFARGESQVAGEVPVAVISHRLANQRFGTGTAAVGRDIRVNEVSFTIVGIVPPDFHGTYAGLAFDLWVPVTMHPALTGEPGTLRARETRWLQAIGRLDRRASLEEARAELRTLSSRIAETYPDGEGREAFVKPLETGAARRLEALFTVLLGITALVALIVCLNVANLLMLRGAVRRHEIGVRVALGASRARILSQLMLEAALLGLAGAAAGLLLARWGQGLLPALMPPSPLPLSLEGRWDLRSAVFALALAAAMVLLFAVVPALRTLRGAVLPGSSPGRAGAGRGATRLRSALVVGQLGLSVAALVCAGVFLRAGANLSAIDRGFNRPDEVLLVATELDHAGYRTHEQRTQAADRLLSAVRAVGGVRAATLAVFVPLGFTGYSAVPVTVAGYVPRPSESMTILSNRVGTDYFTTLGIAVREGRPIDARDTVASAPVVVVNEAFVQRFLAGAEPTGRQLEAGSRRYTIVGVAANGKYRFDALDDPSPPLVYFAYAQQSRASVTLHVRASGPPERLLPDIRATFARVHTALPLNSPITLDEYTSLPLFPVRLGTTVLSLLGAIALLLAATGLYGVAAYRVTQRSKELAVRVALGASPARLARLVVREGLSQAVIGAALGLGFAMLALRVVSSRLPQLPPIHAVVIVVSAGVLVGVALVATLIPAVRASRIDPAQALKSS